MSPPGYVRVRQGVRQGDCPLSVSDLDLRTFSLLYCEYIEVFRGSFCLEAPLSLQGEFGLVQPLAGCARHEDLAWLRDSRHARRDVHVDAEVVAADLARPPEVDPGSELAAVAVRLDGTDGLARRARCPDRAFGVTEGGHHAVPQPLHEAPAVRGDRGVLVRTHSAQQLECRFVADLERPGREVDQVGEEDRHVALTAAASLHLRQRLPYLHGTEAELTCGARPLGAKLGQPPRQHQRRLVTRGGERVAQLAVAGQALTDPLGDLQPLRICVGPDALRERRTRLSSVVPAAPPSSPE